MEQVERTCACLPNLSADGTMATLKGTAEQVKKLGGHFKRIEKAKADQRAAEEDARRQQQRQARAAEMAAETERLSAKVEEARAEAKEALSARAAAGGAEAEADGAEAAFELRKRRKVAEGAAVKSEGPP